MDFNKIDAQFNCDSSRIITKNPEQILCSELQEIRFREF